MKAENFLPRRLFNFDELQSSPDTTMSSDRRAVRPLCDSRQKIFRGCQYTRLSYQQYICSAVVRVPHLPRSAYAYGYSEEALPHY